MRTPIIAGNWKMHKTVNEALDYFASFKGAAKEGVEIVLCVPFPALYPLAKEAKGTGIGIGAQNMHFEEAGAFTGEVSPGMLTSLGVEYVILGHSERRTLFGETDEAVNQKVQAAVKHGLTPIICVGETLEEREEDRTREIVRDQVVKAISGFRSEEVKKMVLAYEPVWAIGSGKASTAEDAQEVIQFIRNVVADQYDQQVANEIRIQYGGSVKPNNIDSFLAQPDIDGALVGGASLDPESFGQLVAAAAQRGDSK
ncbi:triosephosphate isomerase [Marinithermofilum abyssi]|uniref:Triosephosphate isomerase n=1 Tax=Marinithermofilum abyssi TaxID=1571185 RepID=A0A8J2VF21_9BACL|nr:triose-phosphate isomerase [Marinithermofilum abyssi]GGE04081.1 triosephosphate isomerase [Marinithermofilum abyssi]